MRGTGKDWHKAHPAIKKARIVGVGSGWGANTVSMSWCKHVMSDARDRYLL